MVVVACSTGTAPDELVEDWFVSYESGDVAGYQSAISPDMTYLCVNCGRYDRAVAPYFEPAGGAELDARDSRLLALGDGTLNPICDSEGAVVTCETELISAFGFSTEDGEPTQMNRSTYEFTTSDEVITHLKVTRKSRNLFDFSKVQDYRLWAEHNHPDVYDDLFFLTTILIGTDEQWRMHQVLAAEFFSDL
jgi:hypothetical protein